MKRIAGAILLCLTAFVGFAPLAARADISEATLRQFDKGKTTLDQVVAQMGPPGRSEHNDEGLKAIAYLAPGVTANSVGSLFGDSGGLSSKSALAILLFDKSGRMIRYRALAGAGIPITSEDGAGAMPNLSTMQAVVPPPWPMDDKPHLGIHFVPISDIDEKFRHDFAAAKFNGVVVTQVKSGSVAQKAGIKKNDYLYILNGLMITSNDDALAAMATVKKGDTIKAHVQRIDQEANRSQEQIFDLHF